MLECGKYNAATMVSEVNQRKNFDFSRSLIRGVGMNKQIFSRYNSHSHKAVMTQRLLCCVLSIEAW